MVLWLFITYILLLPTCDALDLAIKGISCDESLPISVISGTVDITCTSDQKCTFGDHVLVKGQLIYSGVEYLGMEDNTTAYISGEFDVSVDVLEIPVGVQMALCNEDGGGYSWITVTENTTECPQDGIYDFEATFQLPFYSDSWWATGWHDSGDINLYADANQEHLIGSCKIHYVTQVTSENDFHVPSAFTAFFIVGGVSLVALTWVLFYAICLYRPRKKYLIKQHKYEEEKYYYLNGHGTLSKDAASFRSNDETIITGNSGIPNKRTRWRFRVLACGRRHNVDDDDDDDDDELSDVAFDIPNDVSFDSGIIAARSCDDSSFAAARTISGGSVDESSLSAQSTDASSTGTSGLEDASVSSTTPESSGVEVQVEKSMDYYRFEI